MGRKRDGFISIIFLVLIVADVSSAARLSGLRKKLAGLVTPQDSGGAQVSPSPTPNPEVVDKNKATNDNTTAGNSNVVENPAKENPVTPTTADNSTTKTPEMPKPSANPTPVGSNSTETPAPPPKSTRGAEEGGKKDEEKKTDTNKTVPQQQQLEGGENCTGLPTRCTDQNSLVACFLRFNEESRRFVVLVQNIGEQNLSVDLSAPNPLDDSSIQIGKHQSTKVNLQVGKSDQVILKAGNAECVLHMDPGLIQTSQAGNFVFRLPSYNKLLTPVNGAYLLILTVVLFGVIWGCCCLFRKGRVAQGELPYQELEMAAPDNELPNDLETAEGWDDGWDDDWNDDNSVKSPAVRGSISGTGLTARSSNRDSWDNNWDD
ncbi:unnamed protein product [Linum trigynum]|uniref:DUF7356 domain-containing protein n=1 Tax=Linum trigynum TaxID=586398 RepID=A0AAV2DXS4_9ROSI